MTSTSAVRPPAIQFAGRRWSSEEVGARAAAWAAHLTGALGPRPPLVATPLVNHPDSVALFFALCAGPAAALILSADPRSWATSPRIPAGTPLVLTPGQRDLAGPASAAGLAPVVLPDPAPAAATPRFAFPALVFLTSGTTGLPKPVVKTGEAFLHSARATAAMQEVPRGAGIIGALPLSVNYGFISTLVLATAVEGTLGLLERFDHRAALALFASRAYHYFSCTPFMADVLSRCPLPGPPPPAPPAVMSSAGQLPPAVFRAFVARFGVRPRVTYGSTEGNLVCALAPGDPEQLESVGRPAPGIEVRIGDDPRHPLPAGSTGRIWYSSPWYMRGYGFPGALEPREEVDGWFPTSDLGVLDGAGFLTLLGRSDECFKTAAGHLVNPAQVALTLRAHPAVLDVAVVPLATPAGTAVGVLVETEDELDAAALWTHAATCLPASAQPEAIAPVPVLPRFATGKIDRGACMALLREQTSLGAR